MDLDSDLPSDAERMNEFRQHVYGSMFRTEATLKSILTLLFVLVALVGAGLLYAWYFIHGMRWWS